MRVGNSRIVVCLSILLCLAGTLGADTRWNGTVDKLWSNAANWSNGVPNNTQKAQFVTPTVPECIVDFEGAAAKQIAVGDNGGGTLKVVAGSLTVSDWSIISYAQANTGDQAGHLEVIGGVLNCQARLFIGFQGEGYMVVDNDGVVNVYNQNVGIGEEATGTGHLLLKGGVMNLWAGGSTLHVTKGKSQIDFSGGTLTLTNTAANLATVTQAITDGVMKAYEGAGQVVVDTSSVPGRIVIKGIHRLQPSPEDGGAVSAGQVELKWVLPDPCQPGQTVFADVYFGTDPDFPIGGSVLTPQIISHKSVSSVVVQTQPKIRYYWAVDTYIGSKDDPVLGPIFSFRADNLVPVVDAGTDAASWLTAGAAAVALDATVTDDGFLKPYTVKWTVVSEPNDTTVAFGNATAEDTTVTLNGLGQYVLKLEAYDGEYTGSDTVTINVFNDSCEAAQSLPEYVPIPGDINGDCRVNDLDMEILKAHWLECNALDCNSL